MTEPVVKAVPSHRRSWRPGQTMLIPTVEQIEAYVRSIPPGQHIDATTMRRHLAADARADFTCPVTTNRHLRQITGEAWGAIAACRAPDAVPPFWRMVEESSAIARKLPGVPEFIAARRQREATTS